MTDSELLRMQEAIRGEGLDGWLFWNFHHRDRLADEILRIAPQTVNSRPWLYAVPASGRPRKVSHAIEAGLLDSLIGDRVVYSSQAEWRSAAAALPGRRWGVHLSADLPIISFMDAGTADGLREVGLILESAAGLIQRLKGQLDETALEDHERAADQLYAAVAALWLDVQIAYRSGDAISEGVVRQRLLDDLSVRGLTTDHPPIIAAGPNSGDPHYDFSGSGRRFQAGDIIQIDVWAKFAAADAVYADIAWVGIFGPQPSEAAAGAFTALTSARDMATAFIAAELAAGRRPSGAAVDERVRAALTASGNAAALRHRTGHAIDSECHGSGVNLDSVEFPDQRRLLDGSCFSIEPGLYFPEFGLRTEIDAYIHDGRICVSGGPIQHAFLTCPGPDA